MIPFFLAPAQAATEVSGGMALASSILPFALIMAIFYFMLIRPQKKREKQVAQMRSNIQIGDEVITSGGIIGIVVSMREDTVVIETGGGRSKLLMLRSAIQRNNTIHDESDH